MVARPFDSHSSRSGLAVDALVAVDGRSSGVETARCSGARLGVRWKDLP